MPQTYMGNNVNNCGDFADLSEDDFTTHHPIAFSRIVFSKSGAGKPVKPQRMCFDFLHNHAKTFSFPLVNGSFRRSGNGLRISTPVRRLAAADIYKQSEASITEIAQVFSNPTVRLSEPNSGQSLQWMRTNVVDRLSQID